MFWVKSCKYVYRFPKGLFKEKGRQEINIWGISDPFKEYKSIKTAGSRKENLRAVDIEVLKE